MKVESFSRLTFGNWPKRQLAKKKTLSLDPYLIELPEFRQFFDVFEQNSIIFKIEMPKVAHND